jgi:hypothetical protein
LLKLTAVTEAVISPCSASAKSKFSFGIVSYRVASSPHVLEFFLFLQKNYLLGLLDDL